MWRTWKTKGEDPEALAPLLSSLNPVITAQVNRHRAPRIYKPAIEAHARTLTVQALRRYDPSKSTAIASHVQNNLKGLNRYVKKHQNFTRIVEAQANKIGPYTRAKGLLQEELGRDPTTLEIADHLKMSVKKIERLEMEIRPDIFSLPATGEDAFESSPFEEVSPQHREVLEMLPYELTSDETAVFNHLFGRGGKRKITVMGDIAKELKWSPSKVSQLKDSISKKYRSYLGSF
jgi:DNA-directed RNA polymerase specialized sigma subunit